MCIGDYLINHVRDWSLEAGEADMSNLFLRD